MNDMCGYRIHLLGLVGEAEINAMSPLRMTHQRIGTTGTCFSVRTDQSGFIGLLRHLHDRGFLFLSFQRSDEEDRNRHED